MTTSRQRNRQRMGALSSSLLPSTVHPESAIPLRSRDDRLSYLRGQIVHQCIIKLASYLTEHLETRHVAIIPETKLVEHDTESWNASTSPAAVMENGKNENAYQPTKDETIVDTEHVVAFKGVTEDMYHDLLGAIDGELMGKPIQDTTLINTRPEKSSNIHEEEHPVSPALDMIREEEHPVSPSLDMIREEEHPVSPALDMIREEEQPVSPALDIIHEEEHPLSPALDMIHEKEHPLSPTVDVIHEEEHPVSPALDMIHEEGHSISPALAMNGHLQTDHAVTTNDDADVVAAPIVVPEAAVAATATTPVTVTEGQMTREEAIAEARKQPKSPEVEAELAAKYGAMSLQDRAFAILLDLGMIEITSEN